MILFMCHHSILGGRGYLYLDLTEKTEHDPEKLDFELHVVTGKNFRVVSLRKGGVCPGMARRRYMDGQSGKTEAETASVLSKFILPG